MGVRGKGSGGKGGGKWGKGGGEVGEGSGGKGGGKWGMPTPPLSTPSHIPDCTEYTALIGLHTDQIRYHSAYHTDQTEQNIRLKQKPTHSTQIIQYDEPN